MTKSDALLVEAQFGLEYGIAFASMKGIDATATINNVSSINLTAENSATEVVVKNSLVLKAAVNANTTFPALTWTSSDSEVATVAGGLVTAKKEGTVTITATAKDGSGLAASVTITVTPKVMEPGVEVTNLSELSNDKVYTIRSARAFLLYSEVEGLTNTLCTSNGKKVGSVTYSLTDPNLQFRIEKQGDNYYLYSVGAKKYVSGNGNYEDAAATALKMENVGGAYPWKLIIGSNGMNSQDGGQTDSGIVINSWTTADAGNCYQIVEAGEKIETGIENSEIILQNSAFFYDLQGRRVENPGKGIYIKDNKKVVIK